MNYTEDSNDFKRYQFVKSLFKSCNYKDYNISQLLAEDIARITFKKKFPKAKSIYRYFLIPHPKFFIPYVNKRQILISNLFPERADYVSLTRSVKKEIGLPSVIFDYKSNKKVSIILNVKNIFTSAKEVIRNFKYLKITEILYYSASLTYYKNYLDGLHKFVEKEVLIKYFIAFNCARYPDNILTLFFNRLQIPTYGLQHGAFVPYRKKIEIDVLNYENITSDYFLCWGESTVKLLSQFGFSPNRCIIAGNPRYKEVVLPNVKNTYNSGLILLGRSVYHEGNILLLKLLSKYKEILNVSFYVKLHPTLDSLFYGRLTSELKLEIVGKETTLKELFQSRLFDFAITYNTTAYYESMLWGIPAFRYSFNENEILRGLNDKFETPEELNDLISLYKTTKTIKTEYSSILKEVFNYGSINYSIFNAAQQELISTPQNRQRSL
ncbi:hypothetical protein [Mangrovibacterium lignilyticum]|uniref:hypothetical protein n=1 Tax=Mangrovibacterium lignilyticum TaxID=2668052 RepID=UPI0013D29E27|nr:hypothetical protein [Mangrovibacterium lignilyticum]